MEKRSDTAVDIARASTIIIALTVADKLLAIAKEMVIAHRFGIAADLDVFNIAYAFPGILLLICAGALVQAFIPQYHEWQKTLSPEKADARALGLLWAAMLFFMLLTAVFFLLGPQVFSLIGYGFDAEQQVLGARLERLLVLLITIDGGGAVLAALLQAKKRFAHLQTAPLLINVVSIIVLLAFSQNLGIDALVWGLLIGTLCKTLYMAAALRSSGFSFSARLLPRPGELIGFALLALPLLGSALMANTNLMVDQVMASSLSAGSVSSLRYAFRIYDMPVQIVILAFTKALFPFISERAATGDHEGLRHYFRQSIILICLLAFPATAGALVLARDLVGILFQRGAFDAAASEQTAQILILFCLGLFFSAYCFVNAVFFSSLKKNMTMLYMGILSVTLNIGLNCLFMRFFDVQGIAASTTVTAGIVSCLFMYLLKRQLGIADFSRVYANMRIIGFASLAMLAAGWAARAFLGSLAIALLPGFCAAAAVMACVFCACLLLFRTAELEGYLTLVKGMLARTRN